MEYRITVGERQETLEFLEIEDGYRVRLGDRTFEVDIRRLEPGSVLSMLVDGRSLEAEVGAAAGGYHVHLATGSFEVGVQQELLAQAGATRAPAQASGPVSVDTDIPGVVVEVKVEPGETVAAGQALVIVEAMKMQNELSAPQPGVVRAVHVEGGQTVAAGTTLVTIDSETDAG